MKNIFKTLVFSAFITLTLGAGQAFAAPTQSVLWVGDSYPTGTGANVPRSTGYSRQTANAMNWQLYLDAQGGTGFTTVGRNANGNHQTMPDRLPADIANYNPNYVIIDGGRHDGANQRALDAAANYYTSVRQAWPNAKIILVVPWEIINPRINDTAYIWHEFYNNLANTNSNTYVIDPIAEGWYPTDQNQAKQYKLAGNVHPNQAGHDLAAQRYAQDLRAIGL